MTWLWTKFLKNKIKKVSRNSQQNNSETITNKNDQEIPKERYISPKKDKQLF